MNSSYIWYKSLSKQYFLLISMTMRQFFINYMSRKQRYQTIFFAESIHASICSLGEELKSRRVLMQWKMAARKCVFCHRWHGVIHHSCNSLIVALFSFLCPLFLNPAAVAVLYSRAMSRILLALSACWSLLGRTLVSRPCMWIMKLFTFVDQINLFLSSLFTFVDHMNLFP